VTGEERNGLAPAANGWKGMGEWRLYLVLCKDFGAFFNIMSAFFSTNREPDRKFSILARVCFGAKRALL